MIEKFPEEDVDSLLKAIMLSDSLIECLKESKAEIHTAITALVMVLNGVLSQTNRDIKDKTLQQLDKLIDARFEEKEGEE